MPRVNHLDHVKVGVWKDLWPMTVCSSRFVVDNISMEEKEFSDWVRAQDPQGRMLNPFFAALLS